MMLSQLACRRESLDPRTASSQLARRLRRILAEQRDNGEEFNIAWSPGCQGRRCKLGTRDD